MSIWQEAKEINAKAMAAKAKIASPNTLTAGRYVTGHPDMPAPVDEAYVSIESDRAIIFSSKLPEISSIPLASITNVTAEDHSTLSSRVTATRVLLAGPLALFMKKQKKNESHYVVVDWKEGNFKHNTMFEFEGKKAVTESNILRTALLKAANSAAPMPKEMVAQSIPSNDVVSQLERLAKLRDSGILTDEEFAAQKMKILSA